MEFYILPRFLARFSSLWPSFGPRLPAASSTLRKPDGTGCGRVHRRKTGDIVEVKSVGGQARRRGWCGLCTGGVGQVAATASEPGPGGRQAA